MSEEFSPDEHAQFAAHGVPIDEVRRQIGLLRRPPQFAQLERACRVSDGIHQLTAEETAEAGTAYAAARHEGRLSKFVPASGAATRMFQALLAVGTRDPAITRPKLETLAARGDGAAREVLAFMEGWSRFPFRAELCARAGVDGCDLEALAAAGDFGAIVDYLSTPRGLNYAVLPKGLLPFHRYADETRTAFEEHVVDAAQWLADGRRCRLHFTVSPEHRDLFAALLERVRARYERLLGLELVVTFSTQKRSTDTVAVDLDDRLVRSADGDVLFRPGGHGALIENIAELDGDIVFIENIDNVVPDPLKAETTRWKVLLCGHLLALQRGVFAYLGRLHAGDEDHTLLAEALAFVRDRLDVCVPPTLATAGVTAQRQFLIRKLDRPLRVCGMVPNIGEPGGGPFWVRGADDTVTLQIVESAQVDMRDARQRSIFATATHFNPVELACGLRDWQGRPFALSRYVDADAVFIARKSKDGRELKALERPGLWNGAMADWTTVFVEVPGSMFNPVKTVNDLLRTEHQPG